MEMFKIKTVFKLILNTKFRYNPSQKWISFNG